MTIWWGKNAPDHAEEGDFWIAYGPDVTVPISSGDATTYLEAQDQLREFHDLVVFLHEFQTTAQTSSDPPSPLQEE